MPSELIRNRPPASEIRPASMRAAEPVADGVWMSAGLSNTFLVVTDAGRIVVNTGMGFESGHHRRLFDAVDDSPVRYILLTQGHVDHVGGVDTFRDPGTVLVAQANNPTCQADDARIHRFRVRRSQPYWGDAIAKADAFIRAQPSESPVPAQSTPTPDVLFDDRYEIDLGATRIECIATPGGETIDSMIVWLPRPRVVLVGNVFSALFGHFPNLVTLRADRLRFALPFLDAIDTVRALEPEVLATGHFAPITGAAVIASELDRLRDCVEWVHDDTVRRMNEGEDLATIMREVVPPERISVGEGYGKVSWSVRAIWEGYAGWFHARSTTELYATPASTVWPEIVALAGGPGVVVSAARDRLRRGEAVEAIHLLELVLATSPNDPDALSGFVEAHEMLLARPDAENFWLAGWLRHQIEATRARLGTS